MAQTNYTPIILYNSGTTGNTPSTSNLASGELAINYTDGKLFYKDNSSTLQVIGWKTTPTTAGGTGLTNYTAGDLPYYSSGTALSKLGIGTSGYVLESNGSAPTWVAQSTLSVGTATNATNTAITDNTSSSATWYPTIVSATTGNLPQTTSSTKLSFVPSTGTLTATSHAGAWAGSTIGTTYGGTGLTSFTANGVVYASSSSVLVTGLGLSFDGNNLLVGAATTPSISKSVGLTNIYVAGGNTLTTGSTFGGGVSDNNGSRQGGVGVIMTPGTGGGTTSGAGIGFYTSSNTYAGYSQTYNNSLSWYIIGYGNLLPYSDNAVSLGDSSHRTSVIYSATGTINTSDRTEKQDIQDLSDTEKLVAQEIKGLFKTFRWKDAVAKKGDAARIHVGVIAQDVQDAFTKHGLDAARYALWCSDTWYEKDGFSYYLHEGGNSPEGSVMVTRLGVRYDQLLAFVISAT